MEDLNAEHGWRIMVIKKKKALKMLVLSLTGRCNFSCKYCYAEGHPQDTMSLETAVKAVKMAEASGKTFVLQFSGGEPLLAFHIMRDIIEYVRRQKITAIMQVQTNASLLNQDIVTYLHNARVGIGISLDGRPQVNDELRCLATGAGSCSQILNGVGYLVAQGIGFGITCVVSDTNAEHLSGVVEMAYYLRNARRIGFDLLRAQGRGSSVKPAKAEAIEQGIYHAFQTAERLKKQTGKTMLFSQLERVDTMVKGTMQGFSHCHAMNGEAIFVDAQGNLYACSSLAGNERFCLGHVEEGIHEQRWESVRALMQASMVFCHKCNSLPLCGGGCFARWYGSGYTDHAYDGECALKKTSIQWYMEHRGQEN